MHSHDVRALAIWPPSSHHARRSSSNTPSGPFAGISPILASGGLDASLVLAPCAPAGSSKSNVINPLSTSSVSTFEDAYHRRLAYPTGTTPSTLLTRTGRLLVCTRETGLSVWRIVGRIHAPSSLEADLHAADAMDVDSPDDDAVANGRQEDSTTRYEKLLDMELDTTTNLGASAVSDDGHFLAVSDAYEIKVFELLQSEDGSLRPKRIKTFMSTLLVHLTRDGVTSVGEPEGASALGFTPDNGKLVLATRRSARVVLVDLTRRTPEGTIEPHILRVFDQHAKRSTSISQGRVMKSLPGHTNGFGATAIDESEEESEAGTDIDEAEKQSDDGLDGEDGQMVMVTRMALSPDGQWLATSDTAYRTHIFNLDSVQVNPMRFNCCYDSMVDLSLPL